jgi:transposase-like protein
LLTEFLTEKDPIKARMERLLTDPMWKESEDAWRESMGKVNRLGVRRVRMFISDAHQGIQVAVKKECLRAAWQRCKMHWVIA